MFIAPLALTLACSPQSLLPGGSDPIPALLLQVSAERLMADVERLVSFGTRHTASRTDSESEGIGAARRWLASELEAASAASGGRLQVHTQSFQQAIRTTAGSVDVELVNVFGLLPARGGVEGARTFVVSGHYDSINGDHSDAVGPAPGADDDASGTALVLELARVLSAASFDANLVFLCVPGEEQGLYGSSHFAETLGGLDLNIAGMFTNDIVGGAHDAEFEQDFGHVRVFAGGDAHDASSRELARLVEECATAYVEGFDARLIFHLDRNGRGGDHIPFHEAGIPAVRFTEARELYRRQHKDVSEDGRFGDLPEYVSPEYMAQVTRANGAALLRLALAPAAPGRVRLRGAMTQAARLSWNAVEGASAYEVVWRDTTSHAWQNARRVEATELSLDGVVPDDSYFGVRSLGSDGHASLASSPRRR